MSRFFFIFYLFSLFPVLYGQSERIPYKERKQILIDFAADEYIVPKPTYSDPEKVYWPKVIARLYKYGIQDTIANSILDNPTFTEKLPFHFILVGMARIMPMYPDAPTMVKNKEKYLKNVRDRQDSYNPWTCEGTENHISMSRTSGYIFAELMAEYGPKDYPDAEKWKREMKEWISYFSKTIFEVGSGEFNASTYGIFNIIGWLNLYDFAKDNEVRQMARAVLDYYACELALHYSWGITSGTESRGTPQRISCRAETDYLSWLWFGNITKPIDKTFFKNNTYKPPLQAVHAATSLYRPNKLIVELAHKNFDTPVFYKNSKPAYLLNKPSYIKHFQFINKHYSLGSATFPYGAFATSAYKNVTWKLVSKVDFGKGKSPQMVSGGGMFYDDYQGKVRNPWLQNFQYKNVFIQAIKIPKNSEEILNEITKIFEEWDANWKKDFAIRFSESDVKLTNPYLNPVNLMKEGRLSEKGNGIYINTFNQGNIQQKQKVVFLRLEKSYLAIRSIYQESPQINGGIITDNAPLNKMAGLILEVGDISEFQNFNDFIFSVLDKTKLKVQSKGNKIEYTNLLGDVIEFIYNVNGSYTEPIYDWGYGAQEKSIMQTSPPFIQPVWPSGEGHGRIPNVKVNDKVEDLEAEWPVYSGANFKVDNKILKVSIDGAKYIVDYSGAVPKFISE